MAQIKLFKFDADGYSVEHDPTSDDLTINSLIVDSGIAMGSSKVTGLADGTAAGDAVNRGQLDQAVINGGSFKETLLHESQIDDVEGFLGSIALVMSAQPISGDLITTDDGTTTRTYAAVAGGDVTYALGGSPAITMQNLVDAINGDGSATVTAALTTDLIGIAATVVVITEKDNDAGAHELYGVWATQADVDVVDFTGELDYTKKTLTDMPAASPAGTNFGVRETQATLVDGEMHYVLNNDVVYGWDDSGNTWQALSGSASIPDATGASGGATKGKVTIDTDNGLAIAAGVLSANIDAVTIDFNAGAMEVTGLPALFEINGVPVGAAVTTANLDAVLDGSDADALHTHTGTSVSLAHADLSGVGTDDHHAELHTIASHSDTTATGAELETLTDGSDASALHTHAGTAEAERVETAYTTDGIGVTAGDPVYLSANGIVSSCDANNDNTRQYIGIAKTTVGASAAVVVVSAGKQGSVSITTPVAGALVYLEVGKGLTTVIPPYVSGNHRMVIGKCANTVGQELHISPQYLGKVN